MSVGVAMETAEESVRVDGIVSDLEVKQKRLCKKCRSKERRCHKPGGLATTAERLNRRSEFCTDCIKAIARFNPSSVKEVRRRRTDNEVMPGV